MIRINIIFDANSPSDFIELKYKDSILVDQNIYINSIYVWNDGKEPLTKNIIREPLKFILKDGGSILDYRILQSLPDTIPKFRLYQIDSATLQVDFDFFDPNFGFEAQVIYSGSENSQIIGNGYVLGTSFKRLKYRDDLTKLVGSALFLLIMGVLFTIVSWSYFNKHINKNTRKAKSNSWVEILIMGILLIIGLGLSFTSIFVFYGFFFEYSHFPF